MGSSELNLGFVVDETDLREVVRRLHRRLVEDHPAAATLPEEVRPTALRA
jgi:hypothetical protein